MAYTTSVDPDQTAPVCHSIKYFNKQLYKKIKFRQQKYGIKYMKF